MNLFRSWMISDIFSRFDPINTNISIQNRLINFIIIILLLSIYWGTFSRSSNLFSPLKSIIIDQLSRTYSKILKGLRIILSALFLTLVRINLIGLIPYTFGLSSHIIFTFIFGFPLWLRIIISRFAFSFKKARAHLLPDGAPDWLNPFLVIIETIRVSVRPLTLSFRLAANITAGHIVLTLIRSFTIKGSYINFISLTMFTRGYLIFEFAICLIQAYIFCLLLSLYRNDHSI